MAKNNKIEQKEINRAGAVILEAPVSTDDTQDNQYSFWSFTYNNYVLEHIVHLEQILRHECEWFLFQEEIGEETGTPHLQGTMKFKTRRRLTAIKKYDPKISWRVTVRVNAMVVYCQKELTKKPNGMRWVYGIDIPDEVKVEEPYGWQLEVMNILDTDPDQRSIHWFWEPKGGIGKSTLCKYLVVKKNALMIGGKSNDMFHMISKFPNKRKIIVCDVPKSSYRYINYTALEKIKNGLIFSGKYDSCQIAFNRPHLIVFANEEPDYTEMTDGRFIVHKIQ